MEVRVSDSDVGQSPQRVTFDAIMPAAMAARAEEVGIKKATTDPLTVLILSVLAGAFIGLGAVFATTVSAGSITGTSADGALSFSVGLPYGIVRLLTGLAFSLGLILVVVAGAELFTSNNLIVMAWASGRVKTKAVLFNWALVFAGNSAGALATAALMFCTDQYEFGAGAVGLTALATAHGKMSHGVVPTLILGIMCNVLVCLAIWMSYSARTTLDRIVAIVPPTTAFVAAGFEHSIANIYFVPLGLFIKSGAPDAFWAQVGKAPGDFPALTWTNFFIGNLLPVTVGNVIGGSLMVAAVYWFIYLRKPGRMRDAA
jgi:formate/nitrite transporter